MLFGKHVTGTGLKKGISLVLCALMLTTGISGCASSEPTVNTGRTKAGMDSQTAETNSTEATVTQALEELIACVEEVEELTESIVTEYDLIQDEDPVIRFQKRADLYAQGMSDSKAAWDRADAIRGLDANVQQAAAAYFSMSYESKVAMQEVCVFLHEYLDFWGTNIFSCPVSLDESREMAGFPEFTDREGLEQLFNGLVEWTETAKENAAAITPPSCLTENWTRYKSLLDLNDGVLLKIATALECEDVLSYYSARNLMSRYLLLEDKTYEDMAAMLRGEQAHAAYQNNAATSLAEEIRSLAELDADAQSTYEFEYDSTNKILVGDDHFDYMDTIYPALYNSYDSILIIKTGCVSGTRDIVVEAEIPGFTEKFKQSYRLGPAYQSIHIKPAVLSTVSNLNSAKDVQLNISMYEKDGNTLITSKTYPVHLKSINDFDYEYENDEFQYATYDNFLCFLAPESDSVAALKKNSIAAINTISGGEMGALVGYQGPLFRNDGRGYFATTYTQAAGLMRALSEWGVEYSMDPFSVDGSDQHIKMPDQVLELKSGLCIETSLVIASALQSAGFHTFLLLPRGHALVAVEVWPGSGEYLMIETTILPNTPDEAVEYLNYLLTDDDSVRLSKPYDDYYVHYRSSEDWQEYIESKSAYVIDCADGKMLGLTPLAY